MVKKDQLILTSGLIELKGAFPKAEVNLFSFIKESFTEVDVTYRLFSPQELG